jgi:hypothetical protein
MKIYISGKITGLLIEEYNANFENTEQHVLGKYKKVVTFKQGGGYLCSFLQPPKVINPLNIKPFLGIKTWHGYMINDVRALLKCDSIYMMDNWNESRGARIEFAIALLTKKKILNG